MVVSFRVKQYSQRFRARDVIQHFSLSFLHNITIFHTDSVRVAFNKNFVGNVFQKYSICLLSSSLQHLKHTWWLCKYLMYF